MWIFKKCENELPSQSVHNEYKICENELLPLRSFPNETPTSRNIASCSDVC